MPIKTPRFWTKKNLIALLMTPLSMIYYILMLIDRHIKKSKKISKPVICIGNLTAGGSGKTPVAIAIGKLVRDMLSQNSVAYLSSGYKGKGFNFVSLRDKKYDPDIVGDEPLLLNEIAPTFVAKNRLFGAQEIDKIEQCKAIILDDGLQNKSLHKDLCITVVDGKTAFGNGFLIPAGPMRQPLQMGLRDSDFIVLVGKYPDWLFEKLSSKKIIHADIIANNLDSFSNQKLIAFCGIAYPQKFFSFLKESNLQVIHEESFLDHYRYQNQDLAKLCKMARNKGAKLITTKKDWIKFPDLYKKKIDYLDIELKFLDETFIKNELKKIL